MTIAIGYIRRSHASDERTVSLHAQRAAVERYAAERGWAVAAVVEHDGVSGAKRSRFDALNAAVKQHKANRVIAYHLDRVARDAAALLDWCASAAKRGIELHIVGRGQVETMSSAGYLGVGVEALVAAHHRLVTGEKTRAALAHLRSQGRRWANTPPYGSRWDPAGRVESDTVEAAVVARARALRAEGRTLREISAALGPVSRAGTMLSPETINACLGRKP